jgi:hypothetical protein
VAMGVIQFAAKPRIGSAVCNAASSGDDGVVVSLPNKDSTSNIVLRSEWGFSLCPPDFI